MDLSTKAKQFQTYLYHKRTGFYPGPKHPRFIIGMDDFGFYIPDDWMFSVSPYTPFFAVGLSRDGQTSYAYYHFRNTEPACIEAPEFHLFQNDLLTKKVCDLLQRPIKDSEYDIKVWDFLKFSWNWWFVLQCDDMEAKYYSGLLDLSVKDRRYLPATLTMPKYITPTEWKRNYDEWLRYGYMP